ncbi:3-carboxymuconate cyclase, partial [Cucurbitaria berberidis CBS 394.84]
AYQLLVASYKPDTSDTGAIQTLKLSLGLTSDNSSNTLKIVHENHDCGSQPTWLDISLGNNLVACLDEAASSLHDGLIIFKIKLDGSLEKVSSTSVFGGPVSMITYNNKSAVALAHYSPPSISTFTVNPNKSYTPLQNFTFSLPLDPTIVSSTKSLIHQAVLDPTGQYVVFPDLGADLIRVYCIDPGNGMLTEHTPLQSKRGYGPRHATFWSSGDASSIYMFVIHELSNKILSYEVGYPELGGLTFYETDEVSTYGDREVPIGSKAAELLLSPDNNYLVVSNRNGSMFDAPNPDPNNSTTLPSDSLATFRLSVAGKLTFVQLAPTGGSFPRHFSMNNDGSLIAVANQNTFNVNVYSRNVETGIIDDLVASSSNLGPGSL